MKHLWTAAFLLLGGAHLASATESTEPLAAALIKVKASEAVIIDVREVDEIKAGIIDQAIWLPTSEIQAKGPRFAEIMKTLPKDKPVYVYCASGVRSEKVADQLEAQGFKTANLGGYMELTAAGFTAKPAPDAKLQPCPYLCGGK